MLWPVIGEEFGINEYIVNVDLEGPDAGKSDNLISLLVEIGIGRKPGFGRFGELIGNRILDNNRIVDKSFQLPLHWVIMHMYIH